MRGTLGVGGSKEKRSVKIKNPYGLAAVTHPQKMEYRKGKPVTLKNRNYENSGETLPTCP